MILPLDSSINPSHGRNSNTVPEVKSGNRGTKRIPVHPPMFSTTCASLYSGSFKSIMDMPVVISKLAGVAVGGVVYDGCPIISEDITPEISIAGKPCSTQ